MQRAIHKVLSSTNLVHTNTTLLLGLGAEENLKGDSLLHGQHDSYSAFVDSINTSGLTDAAFIAKHNNVVYIATRGDMVIYLVGDNHVQKLLSGDNNASGILQHNTTLFLTTNKTVSYMGGDEDFRQFLDEHTPLAAIHYVKETEEPVDLVAVVFTPTLHELIAPKTTQSQPIATTKSSGFNVGALLTSLGSYRPRTLPWKGIGIAVVCCVLLAGLVYGIQTSRIQQKQAELQKSLDLFEAELPTKYKEISKTTFASFSQGQEAFQSLYKRLQILSTTYGVHPRFAVLRGQIESEERKILKKTSLTPQLFFDTSVEEANWKPIDIAIEKNTAYFLSADAGSIMTLDLTTKSYKTFTEPRLKNSVALAVEDGDVYVLTSAGVLVLRDATWSMLIKSDAAWKSPRDIAIFYKNVYLLDPEADDIHKYVENGGSYAARQSYFKPDTAYDLTGARQIFIDTAVYVVREAQVDRYISGVQDALRKEYPIATPRFQSGIVDVKKHLWVLDTQSIIELSETGAYEQQYTFGVIPLHTIATDGTKLYGLAGTTLYFMK